MGGLNVREVAAEGAAPEQWLVVLHGIYGAGRNWGSVARGIVEASPEWGALLVDLREHGESGGFEPPHTLEATAADLSGLERADAMRAVLGHSFGGKIALLRGKTDESIEQVWVIDSTPEAREPSGSAWGMLRVLRSVPDHFGDRDEAVEALVAGGVERPVALWMTTNLEWREGEYRWRLDLDAMEELLRDFFRTDLWSLVEDPREGLDLHFVRATGSRVLTEEAASRIRAAGQRTGRVFLHDVQGGHWLNADNPDEVVRLLSVHL